MQLIFFSLLLILFGLGVFFVSLKIGVYDNPEFIGNLMTELHGVFVESVLFAIIFGVVGLILQRRTKKQNLFEELDSMRGLRGEEIASKVNSIIMSLMKFGEFDINMANLDLRLGIPSITKRNRFKKRFTYKHIKGDHFWKANLSGIHLYGSQGGYLPVYDNYDFGECDFSNSCLYDCDFGSSCFVACNFKNSRVLNCDFSNARGLTGKMFLFAESLYGSKFSEKITAEIKRIKPQLLSKKPLSDEEVSIRKWKKLVNKGLVPASTT